MGDELVDVAQGGEDLIAVFHPPPALFQLGGGHLALGDVAGDGENETGLRIGFGGPGQPAVRTVAVAVAVFKAEGGLPRGQLCHFGERGGEVVRVEQVEEAGADQPGGRVAEGGFPAGIDPQDGSVQVRDQVEVHRLREKMVGRLLRLEEVGELRVCQWVGMSVRFHGDVCGRER